MGFDNSMKKSRTFLNKVAADKVGIKSIEMIIPITSFDNWTGGTSFAANIYKGFKSFVFTNAIHTASVGILLEGVEVISNISISALIQKSVSSGSGHRGLAFEIDWSILDVEQGWNESTTLSTTQVDLADSAFPFPSQQKVQGLSILKNQFFENSMLLNLMLNSSSTVTRPIPTAWPNFNGLVIEFDVQKI